MWEIVPMVTTMTLVVDPNSVYDATVNLRPRLTAGVRVAAATLKNCMDFAGSKLAVKGGLIN